MIIIKRSQFFWQSRARSISAALVHKRAVAETENLAVAAPCVCERFCCCCVGIDSASALLMHRVGKSTVPRDWHPHGKG